METSEYGESTDLRSIIEGDRRLRTMRIPMATTVSASRSLTARELVDVEEDPDDSDEDFSGFRRRF